VRSHPELEDGPPFDRDEIVSIISRFAPFNGSGDSRPWDRFCELRHPME
jgi:hypothetical protein